MSRASHLKVVEFDDNGEVHAPDCKACVGCGVPLIGKRRDATCCSQRCYRAGRRAAMRGIPVVELEDGRGRHGNQVRASAHPQWAGGVAVDPRGYLLVRVGPEHPLAHAKGYAYLHRLVWHAAQAASLADDIHHDDEDKQNNRLTNLKNLTKSEHGTLHAKRRAAQR